MVQEPTAGRIEVVVAFSPAPRHVELVRVSLGVGSTVRDALAADLD